MKPWTARNSKGYEAPAALAVDVVVLTVRAGVLSVLLVHRDDGAWALPGGFVGLGEAPVDTAARKLTEKTGVRVAPGGRTSSGAGGAPPYLEQLGTFADPGRDPRGWIPSVAHLALVPGDLEPPDPAATWAPARGRRRLAFDHRTILAGALQRLEGKLWWSNVAVGVLPAAFAMSEARAVYEAVAAVRYDPATFSRDLRATGLVEPTGQRRREGRGRPAQLYRFRSHTAAWGAGRRKRVAG
jgi:8-oxo-dGTP diphosphatase